MPLNQIDKNFKEDGLSSSNEVDGLDFDENNYNSKMKLVCICPKCGQNHKMSFHWIGRGTPRKYCPSCKGRN